MIKEDAVVNPIVYCDLFITSLLLIPKQKKNKPISQAGAILDTQLQLLTQFRANEVANCFERSEIELKLRKGNQRGQVRFPAQSNYADDWRAPPVDNVL